MKNIYAILQQKGRDLDRLIKEIQSLRHSIEILREEGDPQLGSMGVNFAPVPKPSNPALPTDAKRWP